MIRSFIRQQLNKVQAKQASTTVELAVEGLSRVVHSAIKANPGKRAYEIGRIAFGNPGDINCPDHKNMLTWSALCELEKRCLIRRHYHVNWAAVDQATKDYLDALMGWGFEDLHAAKMQELPKYRHAVFYSVI
jgi:hypothetical protein